MLPKLWKSWRVLGNSPELKGRKFVQDWIAPTLERQQNDQDADVRYFANRAFQKAVALVSWQVSRRRACELVSSMTTSFTSKLNRIF